MNLSTEKCAQNPPALTPSDRDLLLKSIPNWNYDPEQKVIQRFFKFKNFHEVMAFINAFAWIAHQADHHPEVIFSYNACHVSYQTHTLQDVSRNDFICAAKIDALVGDGH